MPALQSHTSRPSAPSIHPFSSMNPIHPSLVSRLFLSPRSSLTQEFAPAFFPDGTEPSRQTLNLPFSVPSFSWTDPQNRATFFLSPSTRHPRPSARKLSQALRRCNVGAKTVQPRTADARARCSARPWAASLIPFAFPTSLRAFPITTWPHHPTNACYYSQEPCSPTNERPNRPDLPSRRSCRRFYPTTTRV